MSCGLAPAVKPVSSDGIPGWLLQCGGRQRGTVRIAFWRSLWRRKCATKRQSAGLAFLSLNWEARQRKVRAADEITFIRDSRRGGLTRRGRCRRHLRYRRIRNKPARPEERVWNNYRKSKEQREGDQQVLMT